MRKAFKSLTLAGALVILTCSYLSPHQRRDRQSECEESPNPKPTTTEAPPLAAYNAPARFDVAGAWDFFFSGDFLYWQAVEDNLAYAVSTVNTLGNITNPPINGRVLNVDFGFHPGLRVGFGGNTARDDWDILLQWTHLVSHNNTSSTVPDGGFLYPSKTFPAALVVQDSAYSSWRCIYNVMDFEVGRKYYMGRFWSLRTFGGLRSTWIRQSYNAEYRDVVDASNNNESVGDIHVHRRFNTWGLGPRFGLDFNWILGCGFRLFENNAFSLQYVKPSASISEDAPDFTDRTSASVKNKKGNGTLRPNFDLGMGLGWGCYFDNYNWHVDLSLAYEFQYYWDRNFDLFFVDNLSRGHLYDQSGNLGFHGMTIHARFDF
jgi:hypothetical protein